MGRFRSGAFFGAVLGLAGAWTPIGAFAGGDTVEIAPGGALNFIEESGMRFEPRLYDANWSQQRVRGGWTDSSERTRDFSIVDPSDKPIIDGRLSYATKDAPDAAKDPALTLTWTFAAKRDYEGQSLCVDLTVPCGACFASDPVPPGTSPSVMLDDRRFDFPEKRGEKAWLGGAPCTKMLLRTSRKTLAVEFPSKVWVSVQDNRQWNTETFSIRLSVGDKKLRAGETRTLALTLHGLSGVRSGLCEIAPGADWVPVKDSTAIAPGSALDFSGLGWIDAPAGKHGRVIAKGAHFEFEKKPGVTQRFYGVNLCFDANYMSDATAEELCARLSRMGYNALRIHHYEQALCDRKDGTTIRPEKMAELDNLLNACIRHGIYLTTDLFVSRSVPWRACGFDRDGNVPMDDFKQLVIFHEGAYRNYLSFARALLTHVNPKTGRRWADEPALAFLALVNEGNLGNHGYGFLSGLPEATQAWKAWLAARKSAQPDVFGKISERFPDNAWDNTPQNAAVCLFLADAEIAFAEKMRRFVRDEIGSPVLLTDMSCWKNPVAYQLVRTRYDYVDDHFYVDHPQFLERSWQLPSKCPNANPVKGADAGFEGVFNHRLLDKPFTITEFNYSGPGQYRGVGGILLGAQAALQEYDGIWRFAWSHSPDALLESRAMSYFDVARDPLQRATERAALTLYMRRDLKPLSKSFAIVLPEDAVRGNLGCGPHAVLKDKWYGWHARLGTWVGAEKPVGATDALAFPSVYSADADGFKRRAGSAKPGDGQVAFDRAAGTFRVETPRTQGFFAEKGTVFAGALTATVSGAPAAVWVSALDAAPIATSKRLLLTHVTDVQDTGTRYADSAKTTLLKWGGLPHLMRRGAAEVKLALRGGTFTVYALAADGTRRAEVPAKVLNGALVFTADTARDPKEATCFYEIVRK